MLNTVPTGIRRKAKTRDLARKWRQPVPSIARKRRLWLARRQSWGKPTGC